jgi:hypothetical protein
VVGELREERQPADGRNPTTDHAEVERRDREAGGRAPRSAVSGRERALEREPPEERQRECTGAAAATWTSGGASPPTSIAPAAFVASSGSRPVAKA